MADTRCRSSPSRTFTHVGLPSRLSRLEQNQADLPKDINFHTLRHTFASWAVMHEMSICKLKERIFGDGVLHRSSREEELLQEIKSLKAHDERDAAHEMPTPTVSKLVKS